VLGGCDVSSSMRLVFLDLRIVAPWCATAWMMIEKVGGEGKMNTEVECQNLQRGIKKWGKGSTPFARWEDTFKYKI